MTYVVSAIPLVIILSDISILLMIVSWRGLRLLHGLRRIYHSSVPVISNY